MLSTMPCSGPDQLPGPRESCVERGRHFKRIGHVRVVVDQVRHAAGFAIVETPLLARGGSEIQRHQGVDGSGMRNGRDRPENSLRFIHASSVVGLDPGQIHVDQLRGRELF